MRWRPGPGQGVGQAGDLVIRLAHGRAVGHRITGACSRVLPKFWVIIKVYFQRLQTYVHIIWVVVYHPSPQQTYRSRFSVGSWGQVLVGQSQTGSSGR